MFTLAPQIAEVRVMKKRLAIGLVLGFLFSVTSWARQSSPALSTDEGQQITIGAYNYAHAAPDALLKAERVTDGILRVAGVAIVWLVCSADESSPTNPGCANLVGPMKLTLHIIPKDAAVRLRLKSEVFGIAAEGGEGEFACDAWVFYDKINAAAEQTGLGLPQILGAVIAHELGHLFLGANSHSKIGLMRAHWSREVLLAADLGELDFSDAERARIRNSVVARHQALQAAR
jgi:hypothetical protein